MQTNSFLWIITRERRKKKQQNSEIKRTVFRHKGYEAGGGSLRWNKVGPW